MPLCAFNFDPYRFWRTQLSPPPSSSALLSNITRALSPFFAPGTTWPTCSDWKSYSYCHLMKPSNHFWWKCWLANGPESTNRTTHLTGARSASPVHCRERCAQQSACISACADWPSCRKAVRVQRPILWRSSSEMRQVSSSLHIQRNERSTPWEWPKTDWIKHCI